MADLLLDTPLTPEQITYAKAAKTSGETLLSLIEEILDFSRSRPAGSIWKRRRSRWRRWWRTPSSSWRRAPGQGPRDRLVRGRPPAANVSAMRARLAPGAAQSRRQRHQVHRKGGVAIDRRAGPGDDIRFPGARHRHRPRAAKTRAGFSTTSSRQTPPRRAVRRHRSRAGDLQAHRRTHGRRYRGRERSGEGSTFRVTVALPAAARRRAATSPHPTSPAWRC